MPVITIIGCRMFEDEIMHLLENDPEIEEVLVVEKRLVLKEEVRVTRKRRQVRNPQRVTLRREEVVVERSRSKQDD